MNASPWTPGPKRFALLSGLALSSLLSCEPSNKVKAGPPQLVLFAPIAGDGTAVPLADPDGGAMLTVPARSNVAAVFDRLLDPVYLEDLTDAGETGKTGVATILTGTGHSDTNITYIPNGSKDALLFQPGVFGDQAGPHILIVPSPTLPSGTTVTVTLDKTKVKSKAGEPFEVGNDAMGVPLTRETLSFSTEPLAVAFGPEPDADAGATCGSLQASGDKSVVTLTFNNAMNPTTIGAHVSVTAKDAAGATLPGVDALATKTASDSDAAVVTVQPASGSDGGVSGWPVGATLTVTVAAAAQDAALGIALGTPTSACFVVGGSS